MADKTTPTVVTFIRYPTGEISIRLDDSQPGGDDCLTLPIAIRDDGGIYFYAADAERLQDFMAARAATTVPGVK